MPLSPVGKSKLRTIGSWALRIALAVAFLVPAVIKLRGNPAAVAEFDQVGLGQWFRFFTATCEIVGAGLLVWPRTVFYGAALLGAVCMGAFFAQLLALHGDAIHTIVLAAILGAVAWSHKSGFIEALSPPAIARS